MGIKIGNTDISKIKIASGLTPRLPSTYQEVEYIQSTGTQYIETGVAGSMDMTTELKLNSQYIGESAIFGSAWSLNGNFLMFYNDAIRWNSSTAVDVGCSLNTDYTIATENGKITVNGTSYTNTASSSVSTNDVKLFECATGPMGQFKLYYFKIRKGGTIVRDFVPCYRKADGEIGLYDLVNDTFYTNSGSGTFTKGDDVNVPYKDIKKVFLGSTQIRPSGGGWQPGANTVGYRPLTTTTQGADQSGNGYDLSGSYRTFGTYAGVDCVEVSGGSNSNPRLYNSSIPIGTNRTASIWFYGLSGGAVQGIICTGHDYVNSIIGGGIWSDDAPRLADWITVGGKGTGNILNAWHLMTVTYDGTTAILYIDGVESTRASWNRTSDTAIAFSHKTYYNGGSQYAERFEGYLSEAIYEDKTWTAQEVSDYFDQTKSAYGLS